MGGKSSSPDYSGAAIAQGEANRDVVRDQTYANRPTQNTPWGQTSWEAATKIDPATNEKVTGWTQNTTLDPRLQEILNKQIGVQGQRSDIALNLGDRMQNEFGQAMDWSRFSPMAPGAETQLTVAEGAATGFDTSQLPGVGINQQTSLDYSNLPELSRQDPGMTDVQRQVDISGIQNVQDPYQTRSQAEDAVYNQAMSRLQPQFESEKQQMEVKLRNQGLRPGDAAYDAQMSSVGQRQTDAMNQALWSANQAGRDESAQMFGQQMGLRQQGVGEQFQLGNFANQAAGQQFGQNLQRGGFLSDQDLRNRQQMQNEANMMGQFYNDANQNLFGMQSGLRGQFFGENMGLANLYNQGSQQNFSQNLAANNQNFNQSMRAAEYANQIRQQQIAEAQGQRGQSLNEINALLSGQQVSMPQMPSFMGASAAQPAPIYQGAVDQGNFNQGQMQNLMQGVGGLASLGMGFL